MRIRRIMAMPTILDAKDLRRAGGIHESIFRSYHILGKVKDLLTEGTPAGVILELITEMECE